MLRNQHSNVYFELLMEIKNDNEINEDCIYAIISFDKTGTLPPEGAEGNAQLPHGPNGTCFFISANTFATANHVLNSKNIHQKDFYLVNKKGHIIDSITIEK